MSRLKVISIALFTICFFGIALFTLPHYGINWDTINHLPRGQAFLNFFLTGNKNYDNLPPYINNFQDPEKLGIKTDIPDPMFARRSLYQHSLAPFDFYIEENKYGHPPLSDIFSAVFNFVLFQKFGLVNDIDSYRVYGVLLASVLVGLIFYWGFKTAGWFAGLIAALSLAMYPLFWAESHFNTEKDIPETVYWSFLLFSVWKGVTTKSWKWILLSGIFFGLALGTKFNILFSVSIILPWLAYLYLTKYQPIDFKTLQLGLIGILSVLIGSAIFFVSWPYLWVDPVERLSQILNFYRTIGVQQISDPRFTGIFGINLLPIQWILYTTPPTILLLSIIGIIGSIGKVFKKSNGITVLFLLWLFVPIIRVSWPGANIYGGVRQIMEFIPALALFSGIGAFYLFVTIKKLFKVSIFSEIVIKVLIVMLFVPVLFQLIRYHPYENVYFNFFTGGLAGAKEMDFPYWGNTFGSVYRAGAVWINKNVENGAKIVYSHDHFPNIPRIFLRLDVELNNKYRSGQLAKGEYAIGSVFQGSTTRTYYDKYLEELVNPIHRIMVDGVVILKVWKNDKQHQKYNLVEAKVDALVEKSGNVINIKLPKESKLSKIEFSYPFQDNCLTQDDLTYAQYSLDNIIWLRVSPATTEESLKSILKNNPQAENYIIYFAGEEVKYLQVYTTNSCLLKFNKVQVFEFSKL